MEHYLLIKYDDESGVLYVEGCINVTVTSYGMLELAKDLVREQRNKAGDAKTNSISRKIFHS